MNQKEITAMDRSMARVCELCPVCRHASHSQKGIAYSIVKSIEVTICPFCRAYEKVHGKKAHETRN